MTDRPEAIQPEFDIHWMQRALALARQGTALASPNPMVGCVLLDRSGKLAGEGWHEFDRRDHAEVAAIKAAQNAGVDLRGGTAYVTLEPCNHTGRTGPCTEALIAVGVDRVVAATRDPNPAVAGNGLAALTGAGIEVSLGACESEARRINEPFAHWAISGLPHVTMKVAMTLDGRIAPAPGTQRSRQPHWITGPEARAAVQPMRWQADADVTGVDTVLADDPQMTDRSGRPRRRQLLRVVLDSTLSTPLDSKLVRDAQGDLLIATVSTDARVAEGFRQRGIRVEVFPPDHGRVPLEPLLRKLGSEGILSVLTETGARLNTALLAAGLVDRLQFFVSPQIFGSAAVPAFHSLAVPVSLHAVENERLGPDFCISSRLRDPWPATAV